MAAPKRDPKEQSFEHSLKRLEEIVERLEEGNVPLEQSIKMYEEGINLSKACVEKLLRAEQKVKSLAKDIEGSFHLFDVEPE